MRGFSRTHEEMWARARVASLASADFGSGERVKCQNLTASMGVHQQKEKVAAFRPPLA